LTVLFLGVSSIVERRVIMDFVSLGDSIEWLKPVFGVTFFALILYVCAVRVPTKVLLREEDREKQRKFSLTILSLVIIFAIVVISIS
jgi:heme exporter protein D